MRRGKWGHLRDYIEVERIGPHLRDKIGVICVLKWNQPWYRGQPSDLPMAQKVVAHGRGSRREETPEDKRRQEKTREDKRREEKRREDKRREDKTREPASGQELQDSGVRHSRSVERKRTKLSELVKFCVVC